MQLLSAQQVKEGRNIRDEESRVRSKRIRTEEGKANLALSLARTTAEKEIAALEASVIEARTKTAAEKQTLSREVESLEARKREALRPILETYEQATAEAKRAIEAATTQEAKAVIAQGVAQREREALMQQAEWAKERQDRLDERELDIAKRAAAIQGEETRLKESEKTLADNWLKFHAEVSKFNIDMAARESSVKSERTANMAFRETLDEIARKQRENKRAIKDGFDELAKARKEILGRDT